MDVVNAVCGDYVVVNLVNGAAQGFVCVACVNADFVTVFGWQMDKGVLGVGVVVRWLGEVNGSGITVCGVIIGFVLNGVKVADEGAVFVVGFRAGVSAVSCCVGGGVFGVADGAGVDGDFCGGGVEGGVGDGVALCDVRVSGGGGEYVGGDEGDGGKCGDVHGVWFSGLGFVFLIPLYHEQNQIKNRN